MAALRTEGDAPARVAKPEPARLTTSAEMAYPQSTATNPIPQHVRDDPRWRAIRRAFRYGQTERVRVFVPYVPELEGMVFDNLQRKEKRFLEEVAAQEREYRRALGMGA